MISHKIIPLLEELFTYENKQDKIPKNPFHIIDPANVCAAYARTPEMKRILISFIGDESKMRGVNELKFKGLHEIGCKYSPDYLKKIFDIFFLLDEAPKIYSKKDYVIKIQSKSIGFILAPRIDNDN